MKKSEPFMCNLLALKLCERCDSKKAEAAVQECARKYPDLCDCCFFAKYGGLGAE